MVLVIVQENKVHTNRISSKIYRVNVGMFPYRIIRTCSPDKIMNIVRFPRFSSSQRVIGKSNVFGGTCCSRNEIIRNIQNYSVIPIIAVEFSPPVIPSSVPPFFIKNAHLRVPLCDLVRFSQVPHPAPEPWNMYTEVTLKQHSFSRIEWRIKAYETETSVY